MLGDVILGFNFSYLIYIFGFLMVGVLIWNIFVELNVEFFVVLEWVVIYLVLKLIVIILCYLVNLIVCCVDFEFYKDVVVFVCKYNIFILLDLVYLEIYFGDILLLLVL